MLSRRLFRALVSLAAAAFTGTATLALAYAVRPAFTLEMDRPMPGVLSGFYDSERAGDETFAWSGRQASMRLPGLDRRGAWTCGVRLRGGRADNALPDVVVAVDGVVSGRHATSNDFTVIDVPLAPRTGSGAIITLTTTTFVPGGGDKRELGLFVDRWTCAPDAGFMPLPPGGAMRTAAIGATAFGVVLLVMEAPLLVFAAGVAAISGLQSIPLTRDLGPFGAFAPPIEWLAVVLALLVCIAVVVARFVLRRPLSAMAHVALFVTSAVLYLKLSALFHPSKLVIDALFHAHRLEWVLGGRYFFTQPMPSGVRFPYAIGLYVFSAPWSFLTTDLVTLLRIVVTSAEAIGGLLLYYLVAKCWGDRAVAAMATVLYAVAPTTFEIVGNANLTNAFGQSVALAALAAATAVPLSRGRWTSWTALTLLIAAGLLCHISTLMLLGAILGLLFLLYGFAARPSLRPEAWRLAGALIAATAISVILYYGQFAEAFRSAMQVPAATATSAAGAAQVALPTRMLDAARLTVRSVGWPLMLLAIPGAVIWWRRGWRDRLGLSIVALAVTYVVFTAITAITPVQQAFYRYALEFITRVTLATYPAMVIWAALGAIWAWRQQGLPRICAVIAVGAAVVVAGDAWIEWMR